MLHARWHFGTGFRLSHTLPTIYLHLGCLPCLQLHGGRAAAGGVRGRGTHFPRAGGVHRCAVPLLNTLPAGQAADASLLLHAALSLPVLRMSCCDTPAGDLYRRLVRSGGVLAEADVCRDVVVPLLLTLTFLHANHIVHRWAREGGPPGVVDSTGRGSVHCAAVLSAAGSRLLSQVRCPHTEFTLPLPLLPLPLLPLPQRYQA